MSSPVSHHTDVFPRLKTHCCLPPSHNTLLSSPVLQHTAVFLRLTTHCCLPPSYNILLSSSVSQYTAVFLRLTTHSFLPPSHSTLLSSSVSSSSRMMGGANSLAESFMVSSSGRLTTLILGIVCMRCSRFSRAFMFLTRSAEKLR